MGDQAEALPESGGTDVKTMIGMSVFYVVFGFLCAMIIGSVMKLFNSDYCMSFKSEHSKLMKFFVTITIAITTPIWCNLSGFHESKFILIIFFGYFCFQNWGEDGRPDKELAFFWTFCQPFVFATVGAAVQFKYIEGKSFGLSILVIFIGVGMRWVGTVLAASEPKFNCQEKMFFGFAWIPKATVQAAIGGTVFLNASNLGDNVRPEIKEQWIEWGKVLLSMAVIAVIITAPAGAILTNTLGPMWLEDEVDSEDSHRSMGSQANFPPKIAVEGVDNNVGTDNGQKEATGILHSLNGAVEPSKKAPPATLEVGI